MFDIVITHNNQLTMINVNTSIMYIINYIIILVTNEMKKFFDLTLYS